MIYAATATLFYNVSRSCKPKPVDYPQDNATSPNQAVAKLNGKDPDKRIGPSIILKVMAGDTIQAAVRAYYKQETNPKKKVSIPAEQMLAGLVQALVAPGSQVMATHGDQVMSNARTAGPGLTANDLQSLRQKDPDSKEINKPKAYLNYVFFDKQLNFVEEGSGVRQVDGEAGKLETLSSGKVVAKENGYVYVFTSNESQEDVFFDNFGVMQVTGPVLEETHYYPFGLTMAKISTTAPLKLEAKRKFTRQVLDHKEFSDESGLDWYAFKYRRMDPQIGRFIQIDPLASKYPYNSTYAYAENRVVDGIDLEGTEHIRFDKFKYENNSFDYIKALPNAVIDLFQGVADATWNSGVSNFQSLKKGTWGLDISNELKGIPTGIKDFAKNSFDYTIHTPISQQLKDAASPQSIETGLSILGAAALTKSLPKVDFKLPRINVVDDR